MIRAINSDTRNHVVRVISRRGISDNRYSQQLESARTNVRSTLEKYDRSSFILSAYVPEPARDSFLAIRAFNVEVSKINLKNNYANMGGLTSVDLKFKFWSDFLSRVFRNPNGNETITEPTMFLIRDSLKQGVSLNVDYFNTFLNSRKHWLEKPTFQDIDSICSFGEGTYSQLIYLQQSTLLSSHISPSAISLLEESPSIQNLTTDIAAHIGQANSIASTLLSLKYYAKQELVPLPIDVMAEQDLSQDSLIGYINEISKDKKVKNLELEEKLKNVIFAVSTRANDHLLTGRYKLDKLKEEIKKVSASTNNELVSKYSKSWRGGIPDVIFVPFMNSIPVDIFIKNLQKKDFNILDDRITNSSMNRWRVVWNSFYNYYSRNI
ncbi:hypothetical protein DASC09_036780 [Saccharomycopsis crataegensis]|uniref:Uncharacterized protein n=1 Tax=Saccharomycopsis crataegensis TaxID=43959 RepID=A0AAV5QNK2_9ASCO|nr:hypothetical protein DASC09_036780 [Saccharomycopsis crataegensis]